MNVSPIFAKKRHSEAAPDHVSNPVPDDRTCSGRGYNDSDIDPIELLTCLPLILTYGVLQHLKHLEGSPARRARAGGN